MKTIANLGLAAALSVASAAAFAGDAPARPTFYKDVLPILQEDCQSCHRPSGLNMSGMIAPMSLMDYAEVRPWAKAIVKVVQTKEMPPWHASEAQNGHFRNERTLTAEQIATIERWVATGAQRGNPEDAPAAPEFSNTGWNMGEPDLILDFPEPFFIGDDVEDLYEDITVQLSDEQLPEGRWIKAIEFKPGSEVVHHIIGYAREADDERAEGAEEGQQTRGMLGGNAPGNDQSEYPEGYGIYLPKNALVTFAMHYHKEAGPGTGVYDSSQIGLKFHDKPVSHPVEISTVAHGAFEIPPGVDNWKVGAMKLFEEDTYLMGMMPHMHLRGKAARYTAHYPDGSSEVLLDVPAYDFNWQTSYDYADKKVLPAGTYLEMELWYDNSAENAARVGFDPERSITFGGPTTDEMDLAWYFAAPVKPLETADSGAESSEVQTD